MKRLLYKIVSISMAIVVLFSTMSFTIDMHFCGDTLVDASFFHKAETCGMEMDNPSPETGCSITKKHCCSDKQLSAQGQNELQNSFFKIDFEKQVFITSFVYSYINLFEVQDNEQPSFKDYSPPPLIKPIFKLDETYLI